MGKKKQSNPAGDEANRLQREQMEKQYEYETKVYDFNWEGGVNDPKGAQWKKYNHAVENLAIQKNNAKRSRDYQNDSAMQNWELGVAQQDYQHDQSMRQFRKSEQIAGNQLTYNEAELQAALAREKNVLNEQFIESAFKNQSLIQDLYEDTGGAGYDKAAALLGLEGSQGELQHQRTKQLTNLNQAIGDAQFSTAGKRIQLIDKQGKADYNKANIVQELAGKEAQNKFKKLELDLSSSAARTRADFENDLLLRELRQSRAKSAFDTTERNVQALEGLGKAQLGQAGRSQGKAVQMVLAQLGRTQAFTVESMIHDSNTAAARMKQNRAKALNTVQRAAIADQKIDFEALENIDKVQRDTEETLRSLDVDIDRGELGLDKIDQGIIHAIDNTDIEVSEIDRNLQHARDEAGFDIKKIDWELDNLSDKFAQNQLILQSTLDSAVKASVSNTKDIAQAKAQSDLQAWSNLMLRPDKAPDVPVPISMPEAKYDDIMEPTKPPEPIRGASYQSGSGGDFMQSAMGALSTGLQVGMAAGPVAGAIAGIGSLFL